MRRRDCPAETTPTRPVGASERTLLALYLFTPGSVARARADVLTRGVPLEVYALSNGDLCGRCLEALRREELLEFEASVAVDSCEMG